MFSVLVFVLAAIGAAQDNSSCAIYNQLEASTQCGHSGYALQYGLPNCNVFVERESLYSKSGKLFVNCTRDCLIQYVKNEIIAKNVTDCSTINTDAFKSHVSCYLNCGFCKALITDTVPLVLTYRVTDFLNLLAVEQVAEIVTSCLTNLR